MPIKKPMLTILTSILFLIDLLSPIQITASNLLVFLKSSKVLDVFLILYNPYLNTYGKFLVDFKLAEWKSFESRRFQAIARVKIWFTVLFGSFVVSTGVIYDAKIYKKEVKFALVNYI